jgi:dihydroflavonol-4-reductase
MPKKAFVTGATGFIGANVARVLLEKGRHVRVLYRPESDTGNLPPESEGVEWVKGDLRDPQSFQSGLKGCDELFHVAADYRFWARHPEELYQSNVDGTRSILQAAQNAGVSKVVYTSTVGTIGLADQPNPCNESTSMDPQQLTSHYKRSKLDAEKVALDFAKKGLPVIIVNPSAPIGPWDRKPTPTGQTIVDFVTGKMPAYTDTGLNFVHVRDVAEAQVLASEKGRIGERYILGGQNLSMIEFLKILSKVTGKKAPKVKLPYAVAFVAGYLNTRYSDYISHQPPRVALEAVKMSRRYMFFDSSKAIRELGIPQTPVESAASDAVNWFSENGYFK